MPRIYLERRDMSDELRRLLERLDTEAQAAGIAGECEPPLDVVESPTAIELTLDMPGVDGKTLEIVFSRGTVLIAGVKRPSICSHADAAFHLAERSFGRFARVARIAGAVDAGRARATLTAGELRIVFPRVAERRGAKIAIAFEKS